MDGLLGGGLCGRVGPWLDVERWPGRGKSEEGTGRRGQGEETSLTEVDANGRELCVSVDCDVAHSQPHARHQTTPTTGQQRTPDIHHHHHSSHGGEG